MTTTILIADDDLYNVKYTAFVLEDAGYRVLRAFDGPAVIQAVEHDQPDLVLLDITMPKADGFEICRQIRRTCDVPVIFLSARTQVEDRVIGLQIGADDFLVKPFEPAELLARIEAVLRRRNNEVLSNTASRISRGDLTLDPVEHRVLFKEGREVTLTPIEFRLMYYLMQNSGRVLSPSQILSSVWGYDYNGDSNLVAVYIRRLRTKLADSAGPGQRIVTIANLGYKFEVPQEKRVPVEAAT
jgi:DNA-binding response OmpR family regulator